MGRRGSDDKQWLDVKKRVERRDRGRDRMELALSLVEYKVLRAEARQYLKTIDPAHVIPVGRNYSLCYDEDNIISLNRYSHENLDSYRDPITGKSISKEEVNKWWIRLLKACPSQWESFVSKKYNEELQNEGE